MYQGFGATDPGVQRDHNEDAFWTPAPGHWPAPSQLRQWGALYLVSDGMGGHQAGEVASGMAVSLIPQRFYEDTDPDRAGALVRAIRQANSAIWQAAQQHADQAKMGATLVAAVVQGQQLIVAHVGDSRAYLWRENRLIQLTEDHTWVQERLRAGILSAEEAAHHPLRHVITRSLGEKRDITPTVTPYTFLPGAVLLLCSDGLSGVLSEEQIAQYLHTSPPQLAAAALVRAANEAGGPDNITVVLAPLESETEARSAAAVRVLRPRPAPSRIPLVALLAGLVLLCGVALIALRPWGPDSSKSVFSPPARETAFPTLQATARPFPSPTPSPSPTPLATLPAEFYDKPLAIRNPEHPERYASPTEKGWLRKIFKLFSHGEAEPSCYLPEEPYYIVFSVDVGPEIREAGDFTAGEAYDVEIKETLSSLWDKHPGLADSARWEARIWGAYTYPNTVTAVRIDVRQREENSWEMIYHAPDAKVAGWFYLQQRDLPPQSAGDCQTPEDWMIAYITLSGASSGPGVEESYCLSEYLCSNR